MKKETLEETAERLVPEAGCELNNSEASYWQQGWISGCIEGAKWQQERSYSEEDMIDFAFNTYCYISGIMKVPFNQVTENRIHVLDNLKQFKKK